jgi:ferritin-like metal-binding protein YciE
MNVTSTYDHHHCLVKSVIIIFGIQYSKTMETTTINTLNQLLNEELSTLLGVELKLKEILPTWIDKTHHLLLKNLLRDYLYHVSRHADHLKDYSLSETEGIYHLPEKFVNYFISEVNQRIENCSYEILDAYLLASIQTVNHLKISHYGTVAAWSQLLELGETSLMLHDASINEKHYDERLGELARREINNKARAPYAIMQ